VQPSKIDLVGRVQRSLREQHRTGGALNLPIVLHENVKRYKDYRYDPPAQSQRDLAEQALEREPRDLSFAA